MCTIEDTDNRASGIRGCILHLLNFQDFCCISSILKQLYCIVLYFTVLYWTVLYYWSSLSCIKSWIVIYYKGLKFPHIAAVLLVLESDGACTGLNGRSARTSAVLVLVWCYIARGDREQDLWRCWLPEGHIKQRCDRASGYGCCSKKCEQGEQWTSDLAVSRTSSEALRHTDWKHKIWDIMFHTTDQYFQRCSR